MGGNQMFTMSQGQPVCLGRALPLRRPAGSRQCVRGTVPERNAGGAQLPCMQCCVSEQRPAGAGFVPDAVTRPAGAWCFMRDDSRSEEADAGTGLSGFGLAFCLVSERPYRESGIQKPGVPCNVPDPGL